MIDDPGTEADAIGWNFDGDDIEDLEDIGVDRRCCACGHQPTRSKEKRWGSAPVNGETRPQRRLRILKSLIGKNGYTIFFAGAFRAFKSGSAPRYKLATQYKNVGPFQWDGTKRIKTADMPFSRAITKISAILDPNGKLLHGTYCRKCKLPVPTKWGNCPRCTGPIESV